MLLIDLNDLYNFVHFENYCVYMRAYINIFIYSREIQKRIFTNLYIPLQLLIINVRINKKDKQLDRV
jgi:hypothetical protein